jgi:hypothetical protein
MKIYRVSIQYEALVLAEDQYDAEDYVDDIIDNEHKDISIKELDFNRPKLFFLPPGWSVNTLIYHPDSNDLTVDDAIKIVRQNKE